MAKNKLFEQDILNLLENKQFQTLKDILSSQLPIDIAEYFNEISEKEVLLLFRILPKDLAAETFIEMDFDKQELLIKGFSDVELQYIINDLYIDDMVVLIEEMPSNVVKRILMHTDNQTRTLVNEILQYPPHSAGSIMTTEFIGLRPDMQVKDAIQIIRQHGVDSETIDMCYVMDNNRHLLGIVTIRSLILSNDETSIMDLMDKNAISVVTTEDQETTVNIFDKYNLTVLPVVDKENRLVGIVTVDDAIDVLQKEVTEDFEKMAAITPADKPYLKTSVFDIYKNRIPWLLILMISATFTGMIIGKYENALQSYVILTAYIPMLMDTGGNAGSQASVTMIRGLSLDEIEFQDLPRILSKEFSVSILCGITIAVINFFKLMFFDGVGVHVAIIVCVTLTMTVFVAKLVGSSLPIVAKKMGFDPVVMASPFITTIVDAISLIIYFGIANVLLVF